MATEVMYSAASTRPNGDVTNYSSPDQSRVLAFVDVEEAAGGVISFASVMASGETPATALVRAWRPEPEGDHG